LYSCANSEYSDFQETAYGLKYKFHVKSGDTTLAKYGEIVRLKLVKQLNDSLIESTELVNPAGLDQMIEPGVFAGAIEEGIVMMAIGDSATFLVKTDSINKYYPAKDPTKNYTPNSYLVFHVKLMNIQTKEEVRWVQAQNKKAFVSERKDKESKEIANYVEGNHIDVKPSSLGIYFIEKVKGAGIKPVDGDSVLVHYTGSFLDGTVFDSSIKRNEPFGFVVNAEGPRSIISGWNEVVKKMNKGQVVSVIIPSALAYDSAGYLNPQTGKYFIKPYAPLKFDIELLEVFRKK